MATSTAPKEATGATPVLQLSLVSFAPPVAPSRETAETVDEPEAAKAPSVPRGADGQPAVHLPVRVPQSSNVLPVVLPGLAAELSGAPNSSAATVRVAASASEPRDQTPPAAPLQGAGPALADDAYAAAVIAWLERHKGRPAGSIEGEAVLSFVVDRRGRLRSTEVLKTSGHPAVRGLAMDALHAADPFPRAPSTVTWRSKRLLVRLVYEPR